MFAALALCVGVVATLSMWAALASAERQVAEVQFQAAARERTQVFLELLDRVAFETQGLAAYLSINADLDREQFRTIAQPPLATGTIVHALGWNPVVRDEERAAYEREGRPPGLLAGGITERSASGELVPAGTRDMYVVVHHIHPIEGNEAAIGYDVASEPNRLDALSRARDTATLAVTAPIHLVQDDSTTYGLLAFAPLYDVDAHDLSTRRAAIAGFAVGVLRVPGLVDDAVRPFDPIEADVFLVDTTDSERDRVIYARSLAAAPDGLPLGGDGVLSLQGGLRHVHALEWGGRDWSLVISATEAYLDSRRTWKPLGVLLAGLAITVLFGVFQLVIFRRNARVEALVATLTETNQRLEEQMASREIAEAALRESEERLLLTIEAVTDGSWDWDVSTGEVAFSDSWLAAMDFERDAFPARIEAWLDLVHPDDRERLDQLLKQHLDGATPIFDCEMQIRLSSGAHRWNLTRGRVVARTASGSPLRFVGADTDITGRRAAEDAQQALERRLQHAQKLDSLGLLAGGLAHDLNNLLVGILGSADLALLALSPKAEVASELEQIKVSASRVADLTKQMLDYAGRSQLVFENIDVNSLIAEMLRLLGASVSKNATLHKDLLSTGPRVDADPTQLRQVVMNLITNASDALGGDEGVVRVRTGMGRAGAVDSGTFVVGEPPPGPCVFIEVSDTGEGMDPETQHQMFNPFFSTKFQGRGLGLAAVVGIVGRHGGCIEVDSELGLGTTVRILLPASPTQEALQHPPEPATSHDWRGEGTALVADDEPSVRSLLVRSLERLGFEVLVARDGQEAVERFTEAADSIGIVLLDVTMPRLGGVDACRRIMEQRPDVPVILMSGYTEEIGLRDADQIGYAAFLHKPFTIAALRDAVGGALEDGYT